MFIIDDLLFWLPAKGLVSILKKIEETAVKEQKMVLRKKLLEANSDLEAGRISRQEYEGIEGEIMKELQAGQ